MKAIFADLGQGQYRNIQNRLIEKTIFVGGILRESLSTLYQDNQIESQRFNKNNGN